MQYLNTHNHLSCLNLSLKKVLEKKNLIAKYIEYDSSEHFFMKQLAFFCYHILFKFKHVYFTNEEILLIPQIKVQLWKKNLYTHNTFFTQCYNKNGINFNTNV